MAASDSLRNKQALVARLCASLRADLEALERSHADALQGITHEDARQESDKDMRSTEASYVARGQARRVVELQEELASLETFELRVFSADDPIALGAFVTVEGPQGETYYFLAPAGGGMKVDQAGRTIRVVTPRSPLGRELLGRRVDDDIAWQTPQAEVEGSILAVE